MIALEVSSAAGRPPYGGIGAVVRNIVDRLLRLDPETRYTLCYRLSRWRKGHLFRPDAPNARIRVIQDPFNALILGRSRLIHSMGAFLPRTPRIPKLVTINDLNPIRNPQWVKPEWHEKRGARFRDLAARADHIVTLSRAIAAEVCEEFDFPEERVHPIHLGVDTRVFKPASPEQVRRVREQYGDYVISTGLLTPRKNFPKLIEAMAALKGLRLVLVGRATDGAPQVESAIERYALRERITRLEGIAEAELVGLVGAARAAVVPSLYEGFGLTVLEAMACGTPLVCSNASALPEAAGDAALLVDATDAEALADAIRRSVEDPELAADLRARGLERARAYSWERSARSYRELYARIA